MARTTFHQWAAKLMNRRSSGRKSRRQSRELLFENLGERITPTVNAFALGGTLTVVGDNSDNVIEVGRSTNGNLTVNGGAVRIFGNSPTVANTSRIQMFGFGGNDQLTLNESNGALPAASLYGGDGNDTLTGGSANDVIFGEAGDDILLGKGGTDLLFGGAGNDTLIGGAATDLVFGQAGNDLMIWNPGDGSDLNEGGAGNDTVTVNGSDAAETFTINPNGSRVQFNRTDPAPFSIDIGSSENLVVNANGGNDSVTASNGLATLMRLVVDGGAGNDTIIGGDGNDTLSGGDGDDVVNGGRGNDSIFLGAGNDSFTWNPGDGSDTVEGQDGNDTMIFNGAPVNENVSISANGSRVRFFRDAGNITMDLNGLEQITFNALGGNDNVTVNDLSGTDVTAVNINLAGLLNGAAGDNQADTVTVFGTNAADAIGITGNLGTASVIGLPAQVNITGADSGLDHLVINGQGGDDAIDASGLSANAILFSADGGDGNDALIGGDGNDTLTGGAGDDILFGGLGLDVLDGGPGDNDLIQD